MIQDHSDHAASKETEGSLSRVDLSFPLMHCDRSDLGLLILIRIIPKESTQNFKKGFFVCSLLAFIDYNPPKFEYDSSSAINGSVATRNFDNN